MVPSHGTSDVLATRTLDVPVSGTDPDAVFTDDDKDTVVVTTRHDRHAAYVLGAFEAGKYVFVEKPSPSGATTWTVPPARRGPRERSWAPCAPGVRARARSHERSRGAPEGLRTRSDPA